MRGWGWFGVIGRDRFVTTGKGVSDGRRGKCPPDVTACGPSFTSCEWPSIAEGNGSGVTDDVLPDVTTDDVLPGVTTDDVLPDVTTDDVLPGVTTDDVLPGVTTDDVLPGVTTDDVLPGVTADDVLSSGGAAAGEGEGMEPGKEFWKSVKFVSIDRLVFCGR